MDILAKLDDLHKQATTERSHYYVASCVREARAEIERLQEGFRTLSEINGGKGYVPEFCRRILPR